MSGYDSLAKFYNMYWTADAPQLFESALDRLLFQYLPTGSRVLDLCCGTGQMCKILSEKKFNAIGVDNSDKMLALAKSNAPDAEFILADAREFKLPKKVNAVVCLFDSINHMLMEQDLLSCFCSIRKALKAGGYFIFDVNSIEAFDDNWLNGFTIAEDDSVCVLKPAFNAETGVAVYHTMMFTHTDGELWSRSDSLVYEQYYTDKQLMDCLHEAGFHTVQILDGAEDLGIDGFKDRRFFMVS